MADLIGLIILFLFLGALLFFANIADGEREKGGTGTIWAAVSYGVLVVMYLAAAVIGAGIWLAATLSQSNPEFAEQMKLGPQADLLKTFENPTVFALGLLIPSLIGIVLLLPWVRRLLARIINIDANSSVHAVALSMSMLVIMQIAALLGMGMANLVEATSQNVSSDAMQLATLWLQQLSTAALGIVGVGFLTRRNWSETMERLGLAVPTLRQVALGIGTAFMLVVMVVVLGAVAERVGVGFDENVEKLSEQMMGALFKSPWGILTAGLSAAIGEEILLRGALQPRFGLLLSTIVFALLHGQYGLTLSTLIVFLVGLVLGIVRNRENTSTSMIIHATYNMLLSLMTYLGLEFLNQ